MGYLVVLALSKCGYLVVFQNISSEILIYKSGNHPCEQNNTFLFLD